MTRYKCLFNNCSCVKYKSKRKKKCKNKSKQNKKTYNSLKLCSCCKHGKSWHTKKKAPPTIYDVQFKSPRIMARQPIYYKVQTITIFNPAEYVNIDINNLPLVEAEPVFCDSFINLPV